MHDRIRSATDSADMITLQAARIVELEAQLSDNRRLVGCGDGNTYVVDEVPRVSSHASETAFNAARLRHVVKLCGLETAVPQSDGDLLGSMGSVLGMVARLIEQAQRAAPSPDIAENKKCAARHGEEAARITMLEDGLKFYANGEHFTMHDSNAWDTVSGEPVNFYEDESCTATVEDGSIAKMVLAGTPIPPDDDATQPSTLGQQVAKAQAEMATWSDDQRASVQLQGGDSTPARPDETGGFI